MIITRRSLVQLGIITVLSDAIFSSGKRINPYVREGILNELNGRVSQGWILFHRVSVAQMLNISRVQISLLEQARTILPSKSLASLYSASYRLLGATYYFHGEYRKAKQFHTKAYYAALEVADSWNIAQSLSWQAYVYQSIKDYRSSLQVSDLALEHISSLDDMESVRLRARLYALNAENAAYLGDKARTLCNLESSRDLLTYLPGSHEEFDQASWFQHAGKCMLQFGQGAIAVTYLQQAIEGLSPSWGLRYTSTSLLLAKALMYQKEPEQSMIIAHKALAVAKHTQSPIFVQSFTDYLNRDYNDHSFVH